MRITREVSIARRIALSVMRRLYRVRSAHRLRNAPGYGSIAQLAGLRNALRPAVRGACCVGRRGGGFGRAKFDGGYHYYILLPTPSECI